MECGSGGEMEMTNEECRRTNSGGETLRGDAARVEKTVNAACVAVVEPLGGFWSGLDGFSEFEACDLVSEGSGFREEFRVGTGNRSRRARSRGERMQLPGWRRLEICSHQ